jgi:hypothetical protein
MSAKTLWCASLSVVVAGALLVVSRGTGASSLPLSSEDLQVAVGACEAHGSLQQVSCEKASDICEGVGTTACEADTWHGGCTGVNAPKPEGGGSQNHREVNCTNTYDAGGCIWLSASMRCIATLPTSKGLTCGVKIGSDNC